MTFFEQYSNYLFKHGISDSILTKAIHKDICNQLVPILKDVQPKNVLEIGTFKGFSMGMFRFFVPDSNVVSIDPTSYKEAQNIASLFGNCTLINGDSNKLKNITTKFDFILIDGDHTYNGCKQDWDNIQNNMSDKCIVVFDDLGHLRGCGKVFYDISDNKYTKDTISHDGIECTGILRAQ